MNPWSAGWLAIFGAGLTLEAVAMAKNRNGTLSANLERLTHSHANKAIATGLMAGFVGWFVVHLGLV